uniref:XK-related protein 8-like n=1 Tax=Doryrhamphus excisus TaxID=161450 RepID=UPI0025ADCE06|nr:XK-related protein 8-like [Doryrhamphus excisus]
MGVFKYSKVDCIFTYLGLAFLMLDICLDVGAAVTFYQEEKYVSLGILLLFLLGSSAVVQVYSWLWYTYDNFHMVTKVENSLGRLQLKILHFFQLGTYFRHAGVVEITSCRCITKVQDTEGIAVYLTHDLSMLRLIETFSESAPQLVLMLTIILRQGQLDPMTVMKAVGSASAIALSVTMYHRSLRSFLPDKQEQRIISSLIFFTWNLLLIASRLTALALFASVLPCFIFTHFICSWLFLFFSAWRSKTDFMESPGGEWLYRATVGLIWYFNWFSVVEGRTRYKTLFYHSFILVDMFLLCGMWCWRMHSQPPSFKIPFLHASITSVSVVALYILGLILKVIYYMYQHPNLNKEGLKGDHASAEEKIDIDIDGGGGGDVTVRSFMADDVVDGRTPTQAVRQLYNKRMRKLAENFYS